MSKNSGAGKNSDIYGDTTVSKGTFALKGEAVYGADTNNGNFELKEDATLLVTGKGNKINSSGIVTLAGTLAFDLTGVTPNSTTETLLTLNGSTNGTVINTVDIRAFNGAGTFNLATSSNSTLNITGTKLTLYGEEIDNTRAKDSNSLALINSGKTLQLTASTTLNGTVTWTGIEDTIWNATSDDWIGTIGNETVTKFFHGDDVIFTDTSNGSHEITVQSGGVTIGDTMTFENKGTWTFTGGEIRGGTIIVASNADTTINFDSRQLKQRIEVGNDATATIAPLENETLTFTGLSNNTNGGAIHAANNSNLLISTIGETNSTVIFDTNSATGNGGAIYSNGNVTITADGGDIDFTGNTAGGTPNAIYMNNGDDGKKLSLAATFRNSVRFFDPIASNNSNGNLTIDINKESGETGTVLFDMSAHSGTNKNSNIYGNTTVHNGTFALNGEAVYGATDNNGTFTLHNTATLLTAGNGNKINTGTENVTLNGTLAFENINSSAAALELNTSGNITGSVAAVDIRDTVTSGQRYVLAQNTGSSVFSSLVLPVTLNYMNESIENTRAQDKMLVTTNDTEKSLVLLVGTLDKATVTWTGNANSNWNITDRNWNGKLPNGDNVNQFLHNDDVIFGTSSEKSVAVISTGVIIGDMDITEEGYTFTDGKITGDSLKINATNGETKFQNDIEFSKVINVPTNHTLTFDYSSDKMSTNQFDGDGTLKKDGTGTLTLFKDNALNNNLNLNVQNGEVELTGTNNNYNGNIHLASATSNLTVGNNNSFGGQLTGNGNLSVTSGELELSNSGNTYSGTTTLNGGNLNVTQNGALSPNSLHNIINGTLFVNNTEQTINSLNGTANGKVNLRTGHLTISNGGQFFGQFIGNGNLTHSGGELTLSGNNTNTATGNLYQTGGIMNLQNNWNGNYYQSAETTLHLGNSAHIAGNADFTGSVNLTDKLNVGGNLTYRNKNLSEAFGLTGTKSVEVGGTFELLSGTAMNFKVAENKIKANSVILLGTINFTEIAETPNGKTENVIVANTPLNTTQLDSKFKANKLLVTFAPFYNNTLTTMGIEKYSETAEEYTADQHFRINQIKIAALLDGYSPIQSTLYSLDTSEQLEALINPLLVAEIAAEVHNLPMNHPYFRVFNHLSHLPLNNFQNVNHFRNANNSGTVIRGQKPCSPTDSDFGCGEKNSGYEFWFEGYYRAENINGDINAFGYKTSRSGMMIGVDRIIDNKLMTGLVFGYGSPRAYNSNAKIEADDYTVGTYARLKISEFYANAFLGYGYQNYELRQNVTHAGTKYNGNSMFASLELFKPIRLRDHFTVSPLAAIDFQKSWAEGFNANVTGLPLSVGKSDLEQTILRFGITANYKNLRTRLQYGYQVAGDLYATSRTTITGGNNSRTILSANLGRNMLNIGFGGDFKIGNCTKLFADYDFDLGEHSNAHTGQFGFVTKF
ncbi:MAG: autotransporter domain-containing protein [Planctomycetaceae bacterium]|jgi:predicted outer membrane repeat protein|nr:autotransporter domain-containing protein [Planctomycetaceae bacterium]